MDDYKEIIYVIVMFVYLLFRFFKKKPERQQPNHQPEASPAAPADGKKEKNLLETILEEVERQKQLSKPVNESQPKAGARQKAEIKQKTQKAFDFRKKPVSKTPSAPSTFEWEQADSIDYVEKEEGVSAISKKEKQDLPIEEPTREVQFLFNPREAFMLKTLLERPYH